MRLRTKGYALPMRDGSQTDVILFMNPPARAMVGKACDRAFSQIIGALHQHGQNGDGADGDGALCMTITEVPAFGPIGERLVFPAAGGRTGTRKPGGRRSSSFHSADKGGPGRRGVSFNDPRQCLLWQITEGTALSDLIGGVSRFQSEAGYKGHDYGRLLAKPRNCCD